jgi:hypothetical protein
MTMTDEFQESMGGTTSSGDDGGGADDSKKSSGRGHKNDTASQKTSGTEQGNNAQNTLPGNVKQGRRRRKTEDLREEAPVMIGSRPPGASRHLTKLKLVEQDAEVNICGLTPCQVRDKVADPAFASRYRDMRQVSPPPNIVVIKDIVTGKMLTADGHTRCLAAVMDGEETITADIYEGTRIDARIVGIELNQGSAAMKPAERKAMLDEILDNPELKYSNTEIAMMVGMDRHTVEKRRREREQGDFFAQMRKTRVKSPEEKLESAVNSVLRYIDMYGSEVMIKVLSQLPSNIREDIWQKSGRIDES